MTQDGYYTRVVEGEHLKRSTARFVFVGACILLGLGACDVFNTDGTHHPLKLVKLFVEPGATAAFRPLGSAMRFPVRQQVPHPALPQVYLRAPTRLSTRIAPMTRAEAEGEEEAVAEAEEEPEVDELTMLKEQKAKLVDKLESAMVRAETAESLADKKQRDLLRTLDEKKALSQRLDSYQLIVKGTKGKMLEDLLPILDNFEASNINPTTEGEENIKKAYQNLFEQMAKTFQDLGLVKIEAVGKKFDPELHERVMTEDTDAVEDNTVLKETRTGYKFEGKVLRPSMVSVARNSPKPAAPAEEEEEAKTEEAEPETIDAEKAEEAGAEGADKDTEKS